MRNLKRALSLALASIMLLGMMVTGAGAVESIGFTDADEIVNQEAAAVTSGLGIFDGYTDGSFGPERAVTRAEMAVIICKILNGADVDHSNFTGTSKFTDVPAWAEGYVNYCASMEIVKGVGDGKFDPSSTVTTVQAATMLLKSLGYYTEEDQLKDDWKTVVTGRASSLKLYGALTLGVDEPLTRDNVALLVFNTIQAQRVAYDDNRNLYVNNRNRDEVVTNGTKDWRNTLAENTFDMWIVDGVVTANSLTDDSLSETVNNAPRTRVEFYDARTIEGYVEDYPAQTYQGNPVNNGYPFEYTTGLDMIGHAARVYYKIERNAPYVYAITDRATKWEYISYNENSTLRANAANEAGFRRNTINEIATDDYKVNYDWNNTVGVLKADTNSANDVVLNGPSVNKTLLLISNSSDHKVDVVIVLDQYLDTVRRVIEATETTPVEYKLTTHDGTDQNVPHGTFAVNDYVVVTDIGNQGKMLNIAAPEKVTASISKITGVSDGNGTVKSITADGTEYVGSPVAHHETAKQKLDANTRSLDNTTNFENIQTIGEATLLLDFQGKCIGLAEPEVATNYAYAAQFGVGHSNGSLNTSYGLTVKLHFIDGTSGVYNVNTSSGSSSTNTFKDLKMYVHGGEQEALAIAKLLNNGKGAGATGDYPYVKNNNNDNDAVYDVRDTYNANFGVDANGQLKGIDTETDTGLGIYKVSLRSDNSVVLTKLWSEPNKADVSENTDLNYKQTGPNTAFPNNGNRVRLVPGHSTLVKGDGSNVTQAPYTVTYQGATSAVIPTMYQTDKTAYFYVDGDYTATEYDDANVSVGVKTGVANAIGFTVGSDKDNNGRHESIEQLFVNRVQNPKASDRDTVSAMMVFGYDMGANDNLYFYKEGNYHIYGRNTNAENRAGGELVYVVYDLYDSNGEVKQATYNNNGNYFDIEVARDMVRSNPTGYYTMGGDDISAKFVVTKNGLGGADSNGTVSDGSNKNDREFNVIKTDSAKYRSDKQANLVDGAKNVYILNATVAHDEFTQNMYTLVDDVGGIVGLLDDNVTVIDTTGNRIDSTRAIADKCIAGDTVRVSYCYKTEDYKVKVVFVTGYLPKEQDTNKPGGENTITNGNVSLTAPSYAKPISVVAGVATTPYAFTRPANVPDGATITWDETVWVKDANGNEFMLSQTIGKTARTTAGVNTINSTYAGGLYQWLLMGSTARIVLTNVTPSAYDVKGVGNVTAVTTQLTSTPASAAALTFKVPVAGSVSETQITYTIKNVKKAATDTVNQVTKTVTAPVSDGYATINTGPDTYFATGLVEISATVGESTKFTPKIVMKDATGKFSAAFANDVELEVDGTAVKLPNFTITMPAGVASYDYVITATGLSPEFTEVKDTGKNANVTLSNGQFGASGTDFTATGEVTFTVEIKNVTMQATFTTASGVGGFGTLSAQKFANTSAAAQFTLDADGTKTGKLELTNDAALLPGTATIVSVDGATLVSGGTVDVTARGTSVVFPSVKIADITGAVTFYVKYEPKTSYTITQFTSAQVDTKNDWSTTTAPASPAVEGEVVEITLTAAGNGGGAVVAQSVVVNVTANGNPVELKAADGTSPAEAFDVAAGASGSALSTTYKFTMPAGNVVIAVAAAPAGTP